MVTLNHAIAAAMVHGPAAGSSCSTRSTPTRGSRDITASTPSAAHLLEMAGDHQAAIAHYRPRRAHDEHPRAQLPHDAGRAPHGGAAVTAGSTCGILCA